MDAEIWQRLPEELLHMVLARLPMRVLGKMRTVCKQWRNLLSSPDALQRIVPNWSLHSTPGFLIHISWNWEEDGVESWIIEGGGSYICKLPSHDCIIVDSCKSLLCCRGKGDRSALSIGIPGTSHWRDLPPSPTDFHSFTGMSFDSSTKRCTLVLGDYSYLNRRIEMCIYDSESNAWSTVSLIVADHIRPRGKGIYCKGKFYWLVHTHNPVKFIVAFNISDGRWSEIPLPEGCKKNLTTLSEYDGQVVLLDPSVFHCIRLWKLNEAEKYEIWRELRGNGLTDEFHFGFLFLVAVNSSGFVMVIDLEKRLSIFNSRGELVILKMRLPGKRKLTSPPRLLRVTGSAFESNNVWWP